MLVHQPLHIDPTQDAAAAEILSHTDRPWLPANQLRNATWRPSRRGGEFTRTTPTGYAAAEAVEVVQRATMRLRIRGLTRPRLARMYGRLSMAQEMAPHWTRVNSIASGTIRTRSTGGPGRRADDSDPVSAHWRADRHPTHGGLAVIDDSDYVVRATLFIDGGMILYPGFATGG